MVPVLYTCNETGGLTSAVSFDYGQAQCQEVQPWICSTWPLGDDGG